MPGSDGIVAGESNVSSHLIDWSKTEEVAAGPGVTKRAIEGEGASFVMIRVAAGTSTPRHSHAHEQFVHVASGTGSLETAQGMRAFGPGCVFHFPTDTWHAARFDTDTVLLEVNLGAPKA